MFETLWDFILVGLILGVGAVMASALWWIAYKILFSALVC